MPSASGQSKGGPHSGAIGTETTAVLHTGGLQFMSEKAVFENALNARPGVLSVDANPVAQAATVRYDPNQTNVADLRKWVEECGYHCARRSVPGHICSPMEEAPSDDRAAGRRRLAREETRPQRPVPTLATTWPGMGDPAAAKPQGHLIRAV
jgi:copper chaperone CopZ